ncbi:DEAD-box ATP-dependent RNA helicase 28 [Zea mays]|uniref:DEAD-box ATP-dependent RNA helicase 28 n=1 Tax=Zea mays TaxID=4577 RepID=A0A1D6ESZ3_MAIZE|nr:DEAD-box ATP-dependent RNA helicase 28 [Zea mays]
MDPSFRFDPDSSDDEAAGAPPRGGPVQSPWEFSSYAESVAAEHARRRTTSIDEKISLLRQERGNPVVPDDSGSDVSGSGEDDSDDEEIEGESGDEEDELEESEDEGGVEGGTDDEEIEGSGDEEAIGDREGDEDGGDEKGGGELGEEDDAHEEEDTVDQNDTSGPVDPSNFFSSSDRASFHANSFLELNLSRPLVRACEALGYQKPTPIQAACIPLALTGRDICGSAITGSGKTAAFSLPVLERLLFRPKRVPAIRVLILTPTRELAAQIHSMVEKLAQFTDIRCCLIVGGLSTKIQEVALRSMPDIVVATPGRIIDHLRNSLSVGLEDLAVVILDEADRLLELGFSAEIQELIRMCPKRRQTMLFSATMTEEIDELVKLSLNKPVRLEADPSLKRPATLTEEVVRIRRARESNQEAVLLALCLKTFKRSVIIFSGTKQSAHRLKIIFGLSGMKAAELHGNLTQAQRLEALELFKKKEVDFLIATDVAARGIDIVGVQTVINFACPRDVKTYLHRVGRTARAGREGYAVTFVTDDDRCLLKAILKSRIVAEKPVAECARLIEQLEGQISIIIREERVEREARKAEMEIAKESLDHGKSTSGVISAKKAEDLRLKEKRRREHEKNLPRKKRRRLEAQREMLEDEDDEKTKENDRGKQPMKGQSLVDAAYRKAKSLKAASKRAPGARKGKKEKNERQHSEKAPNRHEEMRDLFQNDMSEWKQGRSSKKNNKFAPKKSRNSFKSKARYKRK